MIWGALACCELLVFSADLHGPWLWALGLGMQHLRLRWAWSLQCFRSREGAKWSCVMIPTTGPGAATGAGDPKRKFDRTSNEYSCRKEQTYEEEASVEQSEMKPVRLFREQEVRRGKLDH